MRDTWKSIHKVWALLKPPMRPNPEVVEAVARQIAGGDDIVLLGVTPEFSSFGKTLVAVDRLGSMIEALWIGDAPNRRARLGNWLDMPVESASADAVIGDGCLTALSDQPSRLKMLSETARVLRPRGKAVIRLFAGPENPEPLDAIAADVFAGRSPSFCASKWRVAMAIAPDDQDRTVRAVDYRDAFDRTFPDRLALVRATGWDPDVFTLIDMYENSATAFSFASERQLAAEAARFFGSVRFEPSGTYPLAERCPLLVLGEPIAV